MYDADDAIARVDSYIVSVGGGGGHVGERRLVRIESVARSAATAALLDENGEKIEKLESPSSGTSRRRGRRGGRRRSRARSENGSGESS